MEIAFFPRDEFIAERFQYFAGEHVTILAPSGWGKSMLAFQLLDPLSTPQSPTWVLQMKARDETVHRFRKQSGFAMSRNWPAAPRVIRPRGYIVNPASTFDPDIDEAHQYDVFRRVMMSAMKRGKGVKVFADESADLKAIGLDRTMSYFLRQARALKAGFWSATQRPYNAPTMAYGGAMHLFIGNDPDKRSRDRYGEIGGVDKAMVIDATTSLQQYEWLYLRRARAGSVPVLCVVGA